MRKRNLLTDKKTEPDKHGHARILQELIQTPGSLNKTLLQYVVRRNPRSHAPVESQLDHLSQTLPMYFENGGQSVLPAIAQLSTFH